MSKISSSKLPNLVFATVLDRSLDCFGSRTVEPQALRTTALSSELADSSTLNILFFEGAGAA